MNRRQTLKGLLLAPLGVLSSPNEKCVVNGAFHRELKQLCKKWNKDGTYIDKNGNDVIQYGNANDIDISWDVYCPNPCDICKQTPPCQVFECLIHSQCVDSPRRNCKLTNVC